MYLKPLFSIGAAQRCPLHLPTQKTFLLCKYFNIYVSNPISFNAAQPEPLDRF